MDFHSQRARLPNATCVSVAWSSQRAEDLHPVVRLKVVSVDPEVSADRVKKRASRLPMVLVKLLMGLIKWATRLQLT